MILWETIIPLIWALGLLAAIWIIPRRHDSRFHPEYFFPAAGFLGLLFYGLGLFGFLHYIFAGAVTLVLASCLVRAIVHSRADRHVMQFIKTRPILSSALGAATVWFGLASLAFPVTPDALYFHLGLPKLYARVGEAFFTPGNLFSAGPRTMEMVLSAFFTLGLQRAAQFFIMLVAAILILTVWMKAREFDGYGCYAAAIILTVPIFAGQLTGAKNDYLLWGLSFFAFLKYRQYMSSGRRTDLIWAGVGAGMAAGTKAIGLGLYGVLAAAIIYNLILGREKLRHLLYFTFFFALFSAPWYLYSWMITGNPVFPFFNTVFPSPYTTRAFESFNSYLAVKTVQPNLIELIRSPFDLIFNPDKYDGRLGFVLIAFPIMLVFVRRIPGAIKLALGMSLVFYLIWFFGFSYARFLLPVVTLLAIAGSFYMVKSEEHGGRLKTVSLAALVFGLLLVIPPAIRDNSARVASVLSGTSQHEYLAGFRALDPYQRQSAVMTAQLPYIDCWEFLNSKAEPDTRIGILTSFTIRADGYYLDREYIYLNPSEQRQYDFIKLRGDEEINRALGALAISYVVLDSAVVQQFSPGSTWAAFPGFDQFSGGALALVSYCQRNGELVYKDDRYLAYRVF